MKLNEFGFNAACQISLWCILQVFGSIAAQIKISNTNLISQYSISQFLPLNTTFILLSFSLTFIPSLNLFGSIFLSELSISKMKSNVMMILYKRSFFLYLMLMGIMIIFLTDVNIMHINIIPILVLILQIGFMVFLAWIKPYSNSLHVHTISLFTCHFVFLIFLIFINIVNVFRNIEETTVLLVGYFILGCCGIIIVLTIVRLYYEYRYG